MVTRAIRCKLQTTPAASSALEETSQVFAEACNLILEVAMTSDTSNNIKLHRLTYASVRKRFPLSANLAVRAIRRVSAVMTRFKRRGGQPKQFKPGSIDYDARIFSYRAKDETISVTTVHGRLHIPLLLGDYQRQALAGHNPTSATLVKHDKVWYANIVIEDEAEPAPGDGAMGIDLGIRNTAATNTGLLKNGAERSRFKAERARVRASLQSKGTRGAKRVLKRVSGYEHRRIRHENHELAKELVEEAKRHNCGVIRMEQLTGIRSRTRTWNKHRNQMMAGWSFGQLQQFVNYKAEADGIRVEFVDPAYSSQTCYKCGSLGKRRQDVFECTACGRENADINAALNLAGGAAVDRPELTMCV